MAQGRVKHCRRRPRHNLFVLLFLFLFLLWHWNHPIFSWQATETMSAINRTGGFGRGKSHIVVFVCESFINKKEWIALVSGRALQPLLLLFLYIFHARKSQSLPLSSDQ